MDLAWIWKSAILVIAGMVLLRIAGRKSISQMSVATTVIMISIGTTIVQPLANKSTMDSNRLGSGFHYYTNNH
ncbi:hypothetical protein [Paenibacillus sp. 32O-W]|uniref:hypothetical protein n=1 Tax=Paenibacillus sp. 32O-W TaxID=1695218 RepID=UPI001642D17B|nr:hypothetical protein [Paenibacillus sp. 32O-W]